MSAVADPSAGAAVDAVGDGGRLFRRAPLPAGLEVFDAHVNALAPGVAAPDSFYSSIGLDRVVADPSGTGAGPSGTDAAAPGSGAGGGGPRFVGGCAGPPAGTDLLGASAALRDACAGHAGWLPLLRLDAGAGPRPPSGPSARVRVRFGLDGRGSGKEGAVGRAILDDPDLLSGFAGVKLMPQQTGLPGPDVLAAIRASGLPVLVHAGSLCPPAWLERHLLAHLEGPIVLAHLGSWPCAAEYLERAVELAADDDRVHLETSGASIGNFVRHAAGRVPERLLFGSNRPMCAPLVQLMHVASSIDDDGTLAAVAAGNARRVFGASGAPADASAVPGAPA